MEFDKVIVPKEIKQKETIAIHIPVINRPVTSRQLGFGAVGLFLSFLIQLAWAKLFDLPSNIDDKILNICMRIMFFVFVPVMTTILSSYKNNGKYLEEVLFRKISYAKNSDVTFNEKTLRALKNSKKK